MNLFEMQKLIDQTEYWDVYILDFHISNFGDDAILCIYHDDYSYWLIQFSTCYRVQYTTDANEREIPHVCTMKKQQMGYFGQDITISEGDVEGFYKVNMDLSIMNVEILCKEIVVQKINNYPVKNFGIQRM